MKVTLNVLQEILTGLKDSGAVLHYSFKHIVLLSTYM